MGSRQCIDVHVIGFDILNVQGIEAGFVHGNSWQPSSEQNYSGGTVRSDVVTRAETRFDAQVEYKRSGDHISLYD